MVALSFVRQWVVIILFMLCKRSQGVKFATY